MIGDQRGHDGVYALISVLDVSEEYLYKAFF